MDKNTIIGFLLIGGILFAFSWLNRPTPEQLAATRRYNDSIAQIEQKRLDKIAQEAQASDILIRKDTTAVSDSLRETELQKQFGAFAASVEGEEKFVKLENELLELTFSSKGGMVYKARLKDYQTYDSLPLILFEGKENLLGFTFMPSGRTINTTDLYFRPLAGADDRSVTMHLDLGDSKFFEFIYTLEPNSYMLKLDIRQQGMDEILPAGTTFLNMYWDQTMRRQEKGRVFEERYSGIYYKFLADDVEKMSDSKDARKEITNKLKWIGYKNQFFSSALIPDTRFNDAVMNSHVLSNSPDYLKSFHTEATLDYNPRDTEVPGFRFFLGPNSYPLLRAYDKNVPNEEKLELDKLVPLGASIFRLVNTWLIIPTFTFLGKFISNYGIIILLLTIFIKIIIAPLTYKSYMSSAKMRVLRPQIEEINAKYPGQNKAMDRQRATMDLYSRAGINPMSGCLPMLLQMPILFAMFTFFPSSIELRQESFLWAKDLSSYDAIFSWDTYIPLVTPYFGNHISLFCLLMTITNILYTKLNMESTGTQQQMPGMKIMMYGMPLMFLFIFNNYASGLSYYYFVSTLITIVQTYAFRRFVNEKKLLAKLEENKKKPRKKSGFMARLEEAQRQQQAQLKAQQKKKSSPRR